MKKTKDFKSSNSAWYLISGSCMSCQHFLQLKGMVRLLNCIQLKQSNISVPEVSVVDLDLSSVPPIVIARV